MPLAYVLVAANFAYYAISALLSMAQSDGSASAIFGAIWSPDQSVLVDLGMGGAIPLMQGQVWTLVASTYLHANLLHVTVNMICLAMIMPMVEASFGRLRAFILYSLAGLCGALTSAWWGDLYSLGASGAIFGLFGGLIAYGALRDDAVGRRLMAQSAKWAALNFLFGLVAPLTISNAAHFGGFVGGLLGALALIYGFRSIQAFSARHVGYAIAALTLLCLATGAGSATSSTWQAWSDPQGYATAKADGLITQLDALLAQDPDNARARAVRGMTLALRQRHADALPDLDYAIAHGLDTPMLRNNRAWSLFKLNRAADGLADAEAAIAAQPDDPAILDTRAHIYAALGRREEAIADYRAALAIDPTIQESQQGLARLIGN
jgi:membrane associated rhomboid family serine protease